MPCYHPFRAWKHPRTGAVQLSKNTVPDAAPLLIACGGCIGCRTEHAKSWALRCQLELQQHPSAVFTTLTYDEANRPPTLDRHELSDFIKRYRRNLDRQKSAQPIRIRFFASGEYGEKNARPHYHAIIFGANKYHDGLIDRSWGKGFTRTEAVTPARIAYTAGYVTKKIGFKLEPKERVDAETGELYTWQPPFIQMSRNPGIGGEARTHTQSWRTHAVFDGVPMKTPRFYHEAWKRTATAAMLEQLEYEREKYLQTREPITQAQRVASERIAAAKREESSRARKL